MVNLDELKRKILTMEGVHGVTVEGDKIIVFADRQINSVDGVPVQCMKSEKTRTMELRLTDLTELRREVWRPIPGGVSGSDIYNTAGTIGMKVYKNGEAVMLSNTHIFPKIGLPVVQPGPSDGGHKDKAVGEVIETSPIVMNGENEVDAAIASSHEKLADNILDLGIVDGIDSAHLLQRVSKSGRNGVTHGVVMGTNGSFKVSYEEEGEATFNHVIVTTRMAKPGDSGSILVANKKAIGILFAGSNILTLYVPMQEVVKKLGIELVN